MKIKAGQHQAPLLVSSEPSRKRSWPTLTAERRVPRRREQRRGGATPRSAGKYGTKQPYDYPLRIISLSQLLKKYYKASLQRDLDNAISE